MDALFNFQGKTADLVWPRREWMTLAQFLHNDNPATQFVMAWRKEGRPHYVRSKKVTAERAISWAFRTITDEVAPDKRTTFVPYSQNSKGMSRWGCLDFDAHDSDYMRARGFAFAAWQFLLNSDLTVIIETTGGGWHVWCIAKDFRSVRDWSLFLRGVAKAIEAPVKLGICELFPDDTGARLGKGVRVPGSWNPSTNSVNLILWENSQPLLSSLTTPISKLRKSSEVRFTNTKSNDLSLYPQWERSWNLQFDITEPHTRHQKLLELVGAVFQKIGRQQAANLANVQFTGASVSMRGKRGEHAEEFVQMWTDLVDKWTVDLTEIEREKFAALKTENERDAFRIIRNFAWMAREKTQPDFFVSLRNLSERLSMTQPGAAKLLGRFVDLGILKRTAYAVQFKSSARYAWLLSIRPKNSGGGGTINGAS